MLLSMYALLMKVRLFDMWTVLQKGIMVRMVFITWLQFELEIKLGWFIFSSWSSIQMLQPKQICCCKICYCSNNETSESAVTDNRIVMCNGYRVTHVVICCCFCVLFSLLLVSCILKCNDNGFLFIFILMYPSKQTIWNMRPNNQDTKKRSIMYNLIDLKVYQ